MNRLRTVEKKAADSENEFRVYVESHEVRLNGIESRREINKEDSNIRARFFKMRVSIV